MSGKKVLTSILFIAKRIEDMGLKGGSFWRFDIISDLARLFHYSFLLLLRLELQKALTFPPFRTGTHRTRTVLASTAWWRPTTRVSSRSSSMDPPTSPPSLTTWRGNAHARIHAQVSLPESFLYLSRVHPPQRDAECSLPAWGTLSAIRSARGRVYCFCCCYYCLFIYF